MNEDPKALLARETPPLDPNTAGREELLCVPGIGPDRADAIIRIREDHPLRTMADLRAFGIPVKRAGPYLALNGDSSRQSTLVGFNAVN